MATLNLIETTPAAAMDWDDAIARIVRCHGGLTRVYSMLRFRIIPSRFLDDIVQYLPQSGTVLDLGCGFGLFAQCFAMARPNCRFVGIDLDAQRIALAQRSAERLGLGNVTFMALDARAYVPDGPLAAVLTLDLMHHLPREDGDAVLAHLTQALIPGGVLLLKDVTTQPRSMLYFTYLMDLLVTRGGAVAYRSEHEWRSRLLALGLDSVRVHHLWDILPYPHILCVGYRRQKEDRGD
ncbi:MAG: class I SAM-dependent methyltransferase [Anaerolineae bacterium]